MVQLEDVLVVLSAVMLCGISFYLLIRDQKPVPRVLIIYGIVATLFVIGNTGMLQFFYGDNSLLHNIKRICLMSLLGPIAYVDMKEMRIPNQYIILGLVYRGILIPFELLFSAEQFLPGILSEIVAAAALFLAAVLCRLCIKNSIGAGDIKLFGVMGLFLGMDGIWSAVLLSLIISFCVAVFLMVSQKKDKRDSIPFGPALALGTFISIFLTGM